MISAIASARLRRESDAVSGPLARRFGDILRVGDAAAADALVDDALARGLSPAAVQTLVIEPAMVRIGDLWESGAIGVGDEHLATSISHRALVRLFETLSAGLAQARSRERVLLAAAEGQHHVLGLQMIADVLEGAGYDVLYLGADVPMDGLLASVVRHRPAIVGLAVGISVAAATLAESLAAIGDHDPKIRVMLGGRAVPAWLREAGYPFVASSLEVTGVVERMLAAPAPPLPAAVHRLRGRTDDSTWPHEAPADRDVVAERLAKTADEAIDLARVQVRRAEVFRDLAFRDPLTNMANRRAFEDRLAALTGVGGLLMIDVDHFKAVNDALGHEAGDRVLCAIAEAIGRSVRPCDLAARMGGDEFAVLLPGATPMAACEVGDRVRAAVAAWNGPPAGVSVSVSVGVAGFGGESRAALLSADTALYAAKAGGRDQVVPAEGRPEGSG